MQDDLLAGRKTLWQYFQAISNAYEIGEDHVVPDWIDYDDPALYDLEVPDVNENTVDDDLAGHQPHHHALDPLCQRCQGPRQPQTLLMLCRHMNHGLCYNSHTTETS